MKALMDHIKVKMLTSILNVMKRHKFLLLLLLEIQKFKGKKIHKGWNEGTEEWIFAQFENIFWNLLQYFKNKNGGF